MSVALISAGVILYLIGCWVFSKRSREAMTTIMNWPLDVFCAGVDVAYDMPAHLFAAGRGCVEVVRRHGVEFFAFMVLLTCLAVWGCAVWCWHVCKGAVIGAIAGARGQEVYSVNHKATGMDACTIHTLIGDDDDDGDDSPKPNGAALRKPLRLIAA